MERLAAEEPQRHCLALSWRGGQVQGAFGGVSRRTGRRPPLCRDSAALEQNVQAKREEAKAAVEAAPRKERKATQEKFDKELEALNEKLTVAKEAVWLTEKFGEGVYQDIPGLCKVASRDTILNEKGASLTPGAYVGVAPVRMMAWICPADERNPQGTAGIAGRVQPPDGNHLEESGGDGGMKWER